MPFHEGITQQEYDADMAEARRDGVKSGRNAATEDYEGLTPKQVREMKAGHEKADADMKAAQAERDAAKAEQAKLADDLKARDRADVVRAELRKAGFRDDRIDKLLRDVPTDADFSKEETGKPVVDKLKADFPEWLTTAPKQTPNPNTNQNTPPPKSNGVSTSPNTNDGTPAPKPNLSAALTEMVSTKS